VLTLSPTTATTILLFSNLLPRNKESLQFYFKYYDGRPTVPVNVIQVEDLGNIIRLELGEIASQQPNQAVLLVKEGETVVYRDEVHFTATSVDA